MTGEDRPLILVDVDGVINVMAGETERHYGMRNGWRQEYISAGGWRHRMFYNPVMGPALLTLAAGAGAELAWATMWEDGANKWIGPLLGLPRLPVAPAQDYGPRGIYLSTGCKYGPKADTVVPWTQGRPFVWFDDEIEEIATMSVRAQGQLHLPVLVDEYTGLTEEHIGMARDWLEGLRQRTEAARAAERLFGD